jgi:hypothetical protein
MENLSLKCNVYLYKIMLNGGGIFEKSTLSAFAGNKDPMYITLLWK